MRRQHVAFLHVSDILTFPFMKTHQHGALFSDMTNRQARPVAIAPGRAFDGAQDVLGLDLAQMPQVIFQHTLLDGHLGTDVKVLHLAAATSALMQAKVRAAGFDALRRFTVDRGYRGFLEAGFLAIDVGGNHLKRQRTFNEDHLAVRFVGYALRINVEGLHLQQLGRVIRTVFWHFAF